MDEGVQWVQGVPRVQEVLGSEGRQARTAEPRTANLELRTSNLEPLEPLEPPEPLEPFDRASLCPSDSVPVTAPGGETGSRRDNIRHLRHRPRSEEHTSELQSRQY